MSKHKRYTRAEIEHAIKAQLGYWNTYSKRYTEVDLSAMLRQLLDDYRALVKDRKRMEIFKNGFLSYKQAWQDGCIFSEAEREYIDAATLLDTQMKKGTRND